MTRWTDPFWRWLLCNPEASNVRLKRLSFWWGPHGLEGPAVRYDTGAGHRYTASPVWDRARLRVLFGVSLS
jgi:hypothetical protein